MTAYPIPFAPAQRVRQASLMNYISLFSSFSTLVCCALPSVLVLLGMGATVASLLSVAPWLVSMSRHKIWTFTIAGALITLSFVMTYWIAPRLQLGDLCDEDDPTCGQVSRFSRMLLWGSAAVWSFGFFMAYMLGIILDWYEVQWFRVLCGLLVLGVGYSLYLLRLRRYGASMKIRFDERLEERTRLARDLHDTLLQTIQGSRLVAENARKDVHEPAAKMALQRLCEWLERAAKEGRAALEALRVSTTESNHLAWALRQAFEDCNVDGTMELILSVSGASRDMHPIARDEVYRVAYEAIMNACNHSGGRRVSIELAYNWNMLLRIQDDGKGMDPEVLRAGRSGHYGLASMRERAARIGAKITVSGSPKGTTVTLLVPGKAIFKAAQFTGIFNRFRQDRGR
ncbi:MAG TPA: ATP-binding protein [Terriglobales bacterium]|jgi:signal transduction histidine kinase